MYYYSITKQRYQECQSLYPALIPSKSKAVISVVAFSCIYPGKYKIVLKSDKEQKAVDEKITVEEEGREVKLEKPIIYECKATSVDQTIEIYVLNSDNEVVASGKVKIFDQFLQLDHGPDNQLSLIHI